MFYVWGKDDPIPFDHQPRVPFNHQPRVPFSHAPRIPLIHPPPPPLPPIGHQAQNPNGWNGHRAPAENPNGWNGHQAPAGNPNGWNGHQWLCDPPDDMIGAFYPTYEAARDALESWAVQRNVSLTAVRTGRVDGELFRVVLRCRHRYIPENMPKKKHSRSRSAKTLQCTWEALVQSMKAFDKQWIIRVTRNVHTGHSPSQQLKVRKPIKPTKDIFTEEQANEFKRLAADPAVTSNALFDHMKTKFPDASFEISDIYKFRAVMRKSSRNDNPEVEAAPSHAEEAVMPQPPAEAQRRLTNKELQAMERMFSSPDKSAIDVSQAMKLDTRTVMRYKRRWDRHGRLARRPPEPKLKQFHIDKLRELLAENSKLTHRDLQTYLLTKHNVRVSRTLISIRLSGATSLRQSEPVSRPDSTGSDGEAADCDEDEGGVDSDDPGLDSQPDSPQGLFLDQDRSDQESGSQDGDSSDLEGQLQPLLEKAHDRSQAPIEPGDPHITIDGEPVFACPYYRHDPQRFLGDTFCCLGFSRIPDLKSHLCRDHRLPRIICFRCDQVFDNSEALADHQRQETVCPLRQRSVRVGMSEQQEQRMRKHKKRRMRKQQQRVRGQQQVDDINSPVNAWLNIYNILFPGTNPVDSAQPEDAAGDDGSTTRVDPYLRESERKVPTELRLRY